MTVVAADPQQLRRAAEQVRYVAELITRSVAARGDGLAVPAQSGWRSIGELDAAARAWAEHLNRLAAEVEGMAVDLTAVAGALAAADADAAGPWDARAAWAGRAAVVPRSRAGVPG